MYAYKEEERVKVREAVRKTREMIIYIFLTLVENKIKIAKYTLLWLNLVTFQRNLVK